MRTAHFLLFDFLSGIWFVCSQCTTRDGMASGAISEGLHLILLLFHLLLLHLLLLSLSTFFVPKLVAERLRLMRFNNRLIIDYFANVVNILSTSPPDIWNVKNFTTLSLPQHRCHSANEWTCHEFCRKRK